MPASIWWLPQRLSKAAVEWCLFVCSLPWWDVLEQMWINVLICYTKIQVSYIYILSPVSVGDCWGRSNRTLNKALLQRSCIFSSCLEWSRWCARQVSKWMWLARFFASRCLNILKDTSGRSQGFSFLLWSWFWNLPYYWTLNLAFSPNKKLSK